MDVAKRLDFEATDTLQAGRHQQWPVLQETTNALIALQRAVQDLSACTQQKETQIIGLAKQSAEQGIGDNDLKRLKRQFDSNKATYVNLDQKQRFMQGLYGLQLDIDHLTAEKDQYEQQLGKDAETLRAQKASNDQVLALQGAWHSTSARHLPSTVLQHQAVAAVQQTASALLPVPDLS
eukprot:GHRR01032917.1.p1 GENE.GHRR01032917.1~~GHRR01032917.1.p1  ORF type:complete len:179 (+),score=46.49 GHRR01032917.1:781-1317(+)